MNRMLSHRVYCINRIIKNNSIYEEFSSILEPTDDVVPTVGFDSKKISVRGHEITLFDLGGGPKIRGMYKVCSFLREGSPHMQLII